MKSVTKSVTTQKTGLSLRHNSAFQTITGERGVFYPSTLYKNPKNRVNACFEGVFVGGDRSGDS
jgi:hypothetical protein